MNFRSGVLPFAVAAVVVCATPRAATQVRREPGGAQVPVSVDLKVAGETFASKGSGSCTHAAQASIYNVRSQMRTVRFKDGKFSLQLTWWDPLDGSDEIVNLRVTTGATTRSVSTVRGGQPSGTATVTFEPAGKGGSFRVQAKSADGTAIAGTIGCEAFTPHVAEGG